MANPDKLTLQSLDNPNIKLTCQYNPNELKFNKSNAYSSDNQTKEDDQKKSFKGGNSLQITIDLLFDTSTLSRPQSVHNKYIRTLLALMKINKFKNENRPHHCKITWGQANFEPFKLEKGVITSVNVTYTMFSAQGMPIRAKASVTIETLQDKPAGTNPTSRTKPKRTWLVREGDTLDWIAYQEYGNPAHWRHIAEANNLLNPNRLRPGQILKLIPLT